MSGWVIVKTYVNIAIFEWTWFALWLLTRRDHARIPEARAVRL